MTSVTRERHSKVGNNENNNSNNRARTSKEKLRIAFVHPDLGIGGAERLVVDAALALQQHGHTVTMYTSHCDPSHSFDETHDGTLRVQVWGDWLPRHAFGKLHLIMAMLRVLWVTLRLLLGNDKADVIFCDQVSFTVPLLRLTGARVLFYIHFPDKLLSQRGSMLKSFYRIPLDYLEERTTRAADLLVCNSRFTASIVHKHFPSIVGELAVLYPTTTLTKSLVAHDNDAPALPSDVEQYKGHFFLSINRYEQKKNHELAVRALATLLQPNHANFVGEQEKSHVHLVIAGGFDDRVPENRLVFESLASLIRELKLEDHVTMLRSVSGPVKNELLRHCIAVVYTPHNEHFGIVPVEAMSLGRPVIAVNSGGPKETVANGVTGWLCENVADAFGAPMQALLLDRVLGKRMGDAGVKRVDELFGFKAFSRRLNTMVDELVAN